MDDLTRPATPLPTSTEDSAAVEQVLAEMRSLNEQMRADRAELDRLRGEYDLLKVETQRLKAESRTALIRLGAVL